MGFFDRFKKNPEESEPEARLENVPGMLNVKLLFDDKPTIDSQLILAELHKYYQKIDYPQDGKALLFFFPEIKAPFTNSSLPAQCSILVPNEKQEKAKIKEEAFQQNWHWPEAENKARSCQYEILVTDFMTRTLDYKTRFNLFTNFLISTTKATKPQLIYAVTAQKLIEPEASIKCWDGSEKDGLRTLINVRLYNINNGEAGDTLMDTVGLHQFGLPDFQIRFTDYDPGQIGGLLWNYAYYIFENGDVIEDGNTLAGLDDNSKWVCKRQISSVDPERIVIDIQLV